MKLLHIPYKGSPPALVDVIAGRLDVFISSVPTALSQIKGGKISALAVSSNARSASLPDTPTISEAGVKGFDTSTWFGILAPAGTPAAIVAKLNAEINAALKSPEVAKQIDSEGGKPIGGTSAKFAELIKAELGKWSVAVKESGAKPD